MERIFGFHPVRAVLISRPTKVRRLLILAGKERGLEVIVRMAEDVGVRPEVVPHRKFLSIAEFSLEEQQYKDQGVFLLAERRRVYEEQDLDRLRDSRVVLALDQVRNPRNFGGILRSAAFFGVDAILLMKNRSAELTQPLRECQLAARNW